MDKEYLGDGVYIEGFDSGELILTTENGVEVTNSIYLEPEVVTALQTYLRRFSQVLKES